jgi:integrase
MKRHLIFRNPAEAVTPPRPSKRELNPPDADAIRKLLETARNTKYFEYYEALHTALHTGLRRGELLALRWRDVDLDMATISVSRSVYRASGAKNKETGKRIAQPETIYQEPKTAKGRRMVSLMTDRESSASND